MFVKFIFLFTFLSLTNCAFVNHYAMREGNTPVDGKKVSSKEYTNDDVLFYPKENLDYVKNDKKADRQRYFASAEMYNDTGYDLSNDYLGNYMKQLKVDTDTIDEQIKNGNINTKGSELLEKMEYGGLKAHPVSGNIKVMQWLKDNKDKIAYPEYIAEYVNVYVDVKPKKEIRNADFEDATINQTKAINADNIRDYYVNYYLAFNEDYADITSKQVEFKEKPLV